MNTVYPSTVGWKRGSDISLKEGYKTLLSEAFIYMASKLTSIWRQNLLIKTEEG